LAAGNDASFPESCLGKFCGANTLELILNDSSLRWSRPTEFNDPYDCQISPRINSYSNELEALAVAELEKILEGSTSSFSSNSPNVGGIYSTARREFLAGRLTKEDISVPLLQSLANLTSKDGDLATGIAKLNEKFLPVKILCLTKNYRNLLMWSHYAERHKGALLVFKAREMNSRFREASMVNYLESIPYLLTDAELVKIATGQLTIADSPIFDCYVKYMTLSKGKDWEYEQEWRIRGGSGQKPDEPCEDVEFDPVDLFAVVFGCRFDKNKATQLIEESRRRFSHAKWFRAIRLDHAFELDLQELA
jgi:hypothetical protein